MKCSLQNELTSESIRRTNLIHISHNDLDGVAPIILTGFVLKGKTKKVYTRYVKNENVDKEILSALNSMEADSLLLITDVSPSPEVAKEIDRLYQTGYRVVLLDHHKTAEWLNGYKWAVVAGEKDGVLPCATSMYAELLIEAGWTLNQTTLDFIELVRLWDTWEWSKTDNKMPKQLNDLYYLVGFNRFMEMISYILLKGRRIGNRFCFSENAKELLQVESSRIDSYIKGKIETAYHSDMDNMKAVVVFAENYQSELGNQLMLHYSESDLAIIINPSAGKVSFRSVGDKCDVFKLAEQHGGGGHKNAAGSPLTAGLLEQFALPALKCAVHSL